MHDRSKESFRFSYCLFLETIVFDLENTIVTAMYKKNQITEYDASTYVKLFGNSTYKVS